MGLEGSVKLVAPDVMGHQPQRPGPALLGYAAGECRQGEGKELCQSEHLVEERLECSYI